mgnify:CR=1|jgi:hypothetical protein
MPIGLYGKLWRYFECDIDDLFITVLNFVLACLLMVLTLTVLFMAFTSSGAVENVPY